VLLSTVAIGIEQTLHERRVRHDLEARYRLVTGQTFEMMLLAMRERAPRSVNEVLRLAAEDPQVEHVRILDPTGRIRHSSRQEEIGHRVPLHEISGLKPREVRVLRRSVGGHPVAEALSRIDNAPRCRACHPVGDVNGIFDVRLDAGPVVRELHVNRSIVIGLVGTGMLLVFAGLWWLTRRMVLSPLDELQASMRAVAEGKLETQVTIRAPAELRALAASFNEMTRRLQAARRALEEHHQDDLVRADRLATVGELASTMAHEIQNPLAGLSGALQVFAADPCFAEHKEILEELDATVVRLSTTVRDLLRFGRQSEPKLEPTRVCEVLEAVALFMEQQIAGSGHIQIHTHLATDLPPLLLDPQQLRQVLLNLCLNSVQAMKAEGGELHLSCEATAGGARIVVRDTGPGIEPERLRHVFRPFYTTKTRGTGLGLSIARRIVEKMGGRLSLTSEVGVGTTITIELDKPPAPEASEV
jgi:signal transduction histidine kinase